jgi:hypothetical protein
VRKKGQPKGAVGIVALFVSAATNWHHSISLKCWINANLNMHLICVHEASVHKAGSEC